MKDDSSSFAINAGQKGESHMTKNTLSELRAETDRLMRQSLHKTMWPELWHKARMAALAAARNAADVEIERLTREIERLTREGDEARAGVELLRAVLAGAGGERHGRAG